MGKDFQMTNFSVIPGGLHFLTQFATKASYIDSSYTREGEPNYTQALLYITKISTTGPLADVKQ